MANKTDQKDNYRQPGDATNGSSIGKKQRTSEPVIDSSFPIVGIGASAGGLDALKSFFSNTSLGMGIGYVVVVHLSPKQNSILPELLQKVTELPVKAAADGEQILPDHVYVVSPNKEISVSGGLLLVRDLEQTSKDRLPIDYFFRSLAKDQGRNAFSVILSGTGTDGTLGMREVKNEGGLTIVQTEESAKYCGMPHSAIMTGLADLVLPPDIGLRRDRTGR